MSIEHYLPCGLKKREDANYISNFATADVYVQGTSDAIFLKGTNERWSLKKHGEEVPCERRKCVVVWLRLGSGAQIQIGHGTKEEALQEALATLEDLIDHVQSDVKDWFAKST
jgi:hypothetical protein